ncbi:MAG: hypothetical protein AB1428_04745 [Bacteroidota bacterium]
MQNTRQTRLLLSVDASRRYREGEFARVIPPAAGIANLLLCATLEPALRSDSAGGAHLLFVFLESGLIAALNIVYFAGLTSDILDRTRIFPLRPIDRYTCTLVAELRRHLTLGVVLSAAAFCVVLHGATILSGFIAAGIFLLVAVVVELSVSSCALLVRRMRQPSAAALGIAAAVLAAACVGLLVFDIPALLASLPPVRWGAQGLLAAGRGEAGDALLNALYLTAWGGCAAIIGTRYS